MTVEGLVIWGAAGHAKVVRDALGPNAPEVCAVFDNRDLDAPFDDVPLYTGHDALERWLAQRGDPSRIGFVVAVGGDRGRDRIALQQKLTGSGMSPYSVVHPRAFVASGAVCAPGSQVLAMAAVCEAATVGPQSIVNTAATVDHEAELGAGVHIGPGAHLSGLVRVDDFAFVGAGAVVLPRVHVGAGATIGAGAVVLHDVPPGTTVVGNPARELRKPT
ncbi:MAG: NeuD/PglB/VioB family sugar acetyltransferase [Nocardioidaceae bacterium]|nr:NeuD/PglB/VioB family sugar acetyltransferase [Nocardioidaceae bacterium]